MIVFEHSRMEFESDSSQVPGTADYEKNSAIFDLLVGTLEFRLFDLDGHGPLRPDEFRAFYESVERFNFLAVPKGS